MRSRLCGRPTVRTKATNAVLLHSDHDGVLLCHLPQQPHIQGLAKPAARQTASHAQSVQHSSYTADKDYLTAQHGQSFRQAYQGIYRVISDQDLVTVRTSCLRQLL